MVNPQMAASDDEFNQIQNIADRLVNDANAKAVFAFDKHGQPFATSGDIDSLPSTSLGSLTASAGLSGLAKQLYENEFATQLHEGANDNLHIQLVGSRVILVVLFDSKTTLGLVRLRVRKASEELNHILETILKKAQEHGADSPFTEITDDDLDYLFND